MGEEGSKRSDRSAREGGTEESARQALERARVHALQAVSESISALRALIDAASLATNGSPADAHPTLRKLTTSLDELREQMTSGASVVSPAIVDAVLAALDAEIERWEARSAEDPDARPVLRAFIGVREILWEVGFRAPRSEPGRPKTKAKRGAKEAASKPSASTTSKRRRVQRLDVQG